MKIRISFLCRLAFVLATFFTGAIQSAYAVDPFVVSYGEQGVNGRVYNSQTNRTTFTYTISGTDGISTSVLKFFFLETPNCLNTGQVVSATPNDSSWPSNLSWQRPMPDWSTTYVDSTGSAPAFGTAAVRWFGWHGGTSAPPLVTGNSAQVFTVTYSGNIPEGNVNYALRGYVNGQWVLFNKQISGPSCAVVCDGEKRITFDELTGGTSVVNQYQSQGITISAKLGTGSLGSAVAFNSSSPGSQTQLGTPNSAFGGPGLPLHSLSTGDGIGNYSALQRVLTIPGSTSSNAGMIGITLNSPGKLCSVKFINANQAGSAISVFNGSNAQIFSVPVPAKGSNSVQSINVCDRSQTGAASVVFDIAGLVAIDEVVLCIPTVTTTTTVATTVPTTTTRPTTTSRLTTTTAPTTTVMTTSIPPTTVTTRTTTVPTTTTVPATTTVPLTTTVPTTTSVPLTTVPTTSTTVPATTTVPQTTTAPTTTTVAITGCNGVIDSCGVCDGKNECLDCAGVPNGHAKLDCCGVCNGDGTSCPEKCQFFDLRPQKIKSFQNIDELLKSAQTYSLKEAKCRKKRKPAALARMANALETANRARASIASVPDLTKSCDTPYCQKVDETVLLNSSISAIEQLYLYSADAQYGALKACGRRGASKGGRRTSDIVKDERNNQSSIPKTHCQN